MRNLKLCSSAVGGSFFVHFFKILCGIYTIEKLQNCEKGKKEKIRLTNI